MSALANIRGLGRRIAAISLEAALDFISPAVCCACHGPLVHRDAAGERWLPAFCNTCMEKMPLQSPAICQICSAPVGPFVHTSRGCSHCAGSRFAFTSVVSLGVYADFLRELCLQGKSPAGQMLISCLTRRLWELHGERLREWECDLIIPVPMYWRDRLIRRVHPNDSIAESLSRLLECPVQRHVLALRRKLPKQSQLAPSRRRQLPSGSYVGRWQSRVRGKTVLLVDDVLTTGATMHACARELQRLGASRIHAAVLARGLGQR